MSDPRDALLQAHINLIHSSLTPMEATTLIGNVARALVINQVMTKEALLKMIESIVDHKEIKLS